MALSIIHRISGVGLSVSAALIVWWFLAAATSEAYFAVANGFMTSWLGKIILLLSCIGLWFHFTNGIRHLIWDTGSHFGLRRSYLSGITGLVATAVLVVVTLLVA